jgi:hypothetical protein
VRRPSAASARDRYQVEVAENGDKEGPYEGKILNRSKMLRGRRTDKRSANATHAGAEPHLADKKRPTYETDREHLFGVEPILNGF